MMATTNGTDAPSIGHSKPPQSIPKAAVRLAGRACHAESRAMAVLFQPTRARVDGRRYRQIKLKAPFWAQLTIFSAQKK